MNNYEKIKDCLIQFFVNKGLEIEVEESLRETSYNENGDRYLYSGEIDLQVLSMDLIAKNGYKIVKVANGKPVNTVDAFLIDKNNDWYFIEFKDCQISKKKDNIEKKGMGNFLMLIDIFENQDSEVWEEYADFFQFARNRLTYILVCSQAKDPYSYEQIRSFDRLGEKYRPECLMKFKDYFFKDAYAYTEEYFEKRFVHNFSYE